MTLKVFFHEELITAEPHCPCGKLVVTSLTSAFHLVKKPIDNPDNFRTTHEKQPQRSVTKADEKCRRYAISFFISKEQLLKKLKPTFERNPNLRDELGDFIAHGNITDSDGVWDTVNNHGHFSLWKYQTHTLSQNFEIIDEKI